MEAPPGSLISTPSGSQDPFLVVVLTADPSARQRHELTLNCQRRGSYRGKISVAVISFDQFEDDVLIAGGFT